MKKNLNDTSDNEEEKTVEEETREINEGLVELADLKNKYLRALADYQNLERQTQSWKEEFVQYSNAGLIRKLLEVLDNLEKAQEHLNDNGLALIITKLKTILEDEGLVELDLEGKEYDANLAEVISTEPGETNNIVTKVLRKGYQLKDKVIQPGKVVVSTNS